MNKVIGNWSELWPIEEHPKYRRTIEKIGEYEAAAIKSNADYKEFLNSDYLPDKIEGDENTKN